MGFWGFLRLPRFHVRNREDQNVVKPTFAMVFALEIFSCRNVCGGCVPTCVPFGALRAAVSLNRRRGNSVVMSYLFVGG